MVSIFRKILFVLKRHWPIQEAKSELISDIAIAYQAAYKFNKRERDDYLSNNYRGELGEYLKNKYSTFKILDLACGPGNYSKCFRPNLYLGVDFSKDLIEVAKKRNPEYSFQFANILKEDFKDFNPNYTLIMSTLEHLPNLGDCLELLDKSLRNSSIGVVIVWHSPPRASQLWPAIRSVKGSFGKDIFQNNYPLWIFNLKFKIERIQFPVHEVWEIKKGFHQ
jgi:SAM-dependent methyltransferase